MKKVCIITAARSEYGLLRWVIDEVYNDEELELQLVVTGSHLSEEQGMTVRFIEEDGFPISVRLDMHISSENRSDIINSMGYCSFGLAEALSNLQPDIVVVLGDRYELIPIVSASLVAGIPVAHISGGDVTEGAIDNEVRNAVSMMSTLHFPGVASSAENLRRMRGSDNNIFTVGEPGLESFLRFSLMTRDDLSDVLDLDSQTRWGLVTLHPETRLSIDENVAMAENLFRVLQSIDGFQFVISKANADYGGAQINRFWEDSVAKDKNKFRLYSSLGQRRYLSFMRQASCVIGNSSSGIVEAPFLGIPVLNIGNRQKGRHICENVIQCGRSYDEIKAGTDSLFNRPNIVDTYYGDGYTSSRIVSHIKHYLNEK